MGPKEDATVVVDDNFRVYGIEGLRVVDCSIMPTMPTMPSAKTCATTYMIADKTANLILVRQLPASADLRYA